MIADIMMISAGHVINQEKREDITHPATKFSIFSAT